MQLRDKLAFSSPIWKMLIWLFWMALLSIIMMVGYGLYVRSTGNQSVNQLRGVQALQTFAVFILPAILTVWCWNKQPFAWLKMNRLPKGKTASLVVVLMLIVQPGINLIADFNSRITLPAAWEALETSLRAMEESAQELLEMFLNVNSLWGLLGCILLMALLPAVGEEMCFRGVLQQLLSSERSKHIAIWVTAIIFSAIHLQFYGFFARMLLGALLGYLFVWSGSLWLPIIAHFINNCAAVIFYYIGAHTTINAEVIENFGTGSQWWIGAISLLLSSGMLFLLHRSVKTE